MIRTDTQRLARLKRIADLLDSEYRIPGTRIRFGWDSIIGLIPGWGDAAGFLAAGYVIIEGIRLGVPMHVTIRMIANATLELVVGTVPLLGDIFDVFWKANRRNLALIEMHAPDVARVHVRDA